MPGFNFKRHCPAIRGLTPVHWPSSSNCDYYTCAKLVARMERFCPFNLGDQPRIGKRRIRVFGKEGILWGWSVQYSRSVVIGIARCEVSFINNKDYLLDLSRSNRVFWLNSILLLPPWPYHKGAQESWILAPWSNKSAVRFSRSKLHSPELEVFWASLAGRFHC